MESNLIRLANSTANVFVAGGQSPVTISVVDRAAWRVRVSQPSTIEMDGTDEPLVWEGSLAEWRAALATALAE